MFLQTQLTFAGEIYLVLIGAGVALASSLLTIILQHFLTLRHDRITRERRAEEERKREIKKSLTSPTSLTIGGDSFGSIQGNQGAVYSKFNLGEEEEE